MRGITRKVLLLPLLLLLVNPCLLERAERENPLDLQERNDEKGDGSQDSPVENKQTVTKHVKEDGRDSDHLNKDPQLVRFETTYLFL